MNVHNAKRRRSYCEIAGNEFKVAVGEFKNAVGEFKIAVAATELRIALAVCRRLPVGCIRGLMFATMQMVLGRARNQT